MGLSFVKIRFDLFLREMHGRHRKETASLREVAVVRLVMRAMMWVLAAAAVVWACDWLIWQGRTLAGGGYGVVSVDRFVVAPLKGNKEEYYPDGRVEVRCTRSLLPEGLPQVGGKPCWWVERNPVYFDR